MRLLSVKLNCKRLIQADFWAVFMSVLKPAWIRAGHILDKLHPLPRAPNISGKAVASCPQSSKSNEQTIEALNLLKMMDVLNTDTNSEGIQVDSLVIEIDRHRACNLTRHGVALRFNIYAAKRLQKRVDLTLLKTAPDSNCCYFAHHRNEIGKLIVSLQTVKTALDAMIGSLGPERINTELMPSARWFLNPEIKSWQIEERLSEVSSDDPTKKTGILRVSRTDFERLRTILELTVQLNSELNIAVKSIFKMIIER